MKVISKLWFNIQYYFSVQTRLRKLTYRSFERLDSKLKYNIASISGNAAIGAFSMRVNWDDDFKHHVKAYNKGLVTTKKLLSTLKRLGFSKHKAYLVKKDIHESFKEIHKS